MIKVITLILIFASICFFVYYFSGWACEKCKQKWSKLEFENDDIKIDGYFKGTIIDKSTNQLIQPK